MRILRVLGVLALAFFAIVNIVYWQDPWLWRGYTKFITSGGDIQSDQRQTPDEEIRGDGSYRIAVATPEERTVSAAALKAMEDYAREFNSYALIVIHRGKIQTEWYADFWGPTKITQSQSMHKTLQAVLIGVALDQGLIASVNDPVGKYLDEWRDDPRGAITLYQLMIMSSGLTEPGFSPNPFSDGIKWLNSGFSKDVILRAAQFEGWTPGSKFDYNNLNSEILGIVLTRVFKDRYAHILRDKLWQPMGGDRAFVHTDRPAGRAYTSCCLGAPAMDWARVGMMLLGRGEVNGKRVVSADWVAQMVTPSPAARHYGLQTWLGYDDPAMPMGSGSTGAVAPGPFLARDTFFLIGRGQQHVFVSPSQELVVVRLGPALGRNPIKPGFDVTYFVNTAIQGITPSAGL
jgi:CubicO group peptidase (beta-lactamase class C family)